jgi:hypothetical protein
VEGHGGGVSQGASEPTGDGRGVTENAVARRIPGGGKDIQRRARNQWVRRVGMTRNGRRKRSGGAEGARKWASTRKKAAVL